MNFKILSIAFLFIIQSTAYSQSKKSKKKAVVMDSMTVEKYKKEDVGGIEYEEQLGEVDLLEQNNCPSCKENLKRFEKSIGNETKYGYNTKSGQVIIPAVFDVADYTFNSSNDFAVVCIGENCGVIDHLGNYLISMNYKKITFLKEDIFIATNHLDKTGLVNTKNKVLLPFQYDEISYRSDNIYFFRSDKIAGLISINTMKILFQGEYTDIRLAEDKRTIIAYKNEQVKAWLEWPSLNVLDTSYSKITSYTNGNFIVCKNNKYGVVNSKNELLMPIVYESLVNTWSPSSLFIAELNGKKGLITYDNRIVLEIKYDELINQNGFYKVMNNNKYGLVDQLLYKETTPCIYDAIYVATSEKILVQKGKYLGIIRYNNVLVKDFTLEITSKLSESNFPLIYKSGKFYGILDKNLNDLLLAEYDKIEKINFSYYEYMFLLVKKNSKTVINKNGEFILDVSMYDVVLNPYYRYSSSTKKYFVVKKGEKYGLVDFKSQKEVLEPIYDLVAIDRLSQIIVMKNNIYYKCVFDEYGVPQLILIK